MSGHTRTTAVLSHERPFCALRAACANARKRHSEEQLIESRRRRCPGFDSPEAMTHSNRAGTADDTDGDRRVRPRSRASHSTCPRRTPPGWAILGGLGDWNEADPREIQQPVSGISRAGSQISACGRNTKLQARVCRVWSGTCGGPRRSRVSRDPVCRSRRVFGSSFEGYVAPWRRSPQKCRRGPAGDQVLQAPHIAEADEAAALESRSRWNSGRRPGARWRT
jgi:hypothetical protein